MLQIYDIFLLSPGKNKKKVFLSFEAIEFFPRQPWNVTNGSAFVSVVQLVRNDFALFSRFFLAMRETSKQFFLLLASSLLHEPV